MTTPSWWLHCKTCMNVLLTSPYLSFIVEPGDKAVHLSIQRHLLNEDHDEEGNEWIVQVAPGLRFTKKRTTKPRKIQYAPYEIFCFNCTRKFGSLIIMPGWTQPEYLLDQKTIVCYVIDHGALKVFAWAKVRNTLDSMGTSDVHTRPPPLLAEEEEEETTVVQPIVLPTPDSIYETFHPHCQLSTLHDYQIELAISALVENTLVYLQTGRGKTLVAVKVIEELSKLNPNHITLFLVPTGPLVTQQADYIRREYDGNVEPMCGYNTQSRRVVKKKLSNTNILVATPQYVVNLLNDKLLRMEQLCGLVFDEAHHASGNHPYTVILQRVASLPFATRPRILALSASPFGDKICGDQQTRNMLSLCQILDAQLNTPTLVPMVEGLNHVEHRNIVYPDEEIRFRTAIKSYAMACNDIMEHLAQPIGYSVIRIKGSFDTDDSALFQLTGELREMTKKVKCKRKMCPTDQGALLEELCIHLKQVVSIFSKLNVHGLSTMAIALQERVQRMKPQLYGVVRKPYEQYLLPILTNISTHNKVATKVNLILDVIKGANLTQHSRVIVFVRRRRTAIELAIELSKSPIMKGLNPTRFVGHNSYQGMTWEEEQKPTLKKFHSGRIRMLVATNVLEEGLDVPQCSLVIQFDGVLGMTSLIQSRGRARQESSRYVVLCTDTDYKRLQSAIESEMTLSSISAAHASRLSSKSLAQDIINKFSSDMLPKKELPTQSVESILNLDGLRDKRILCIEIGRVFEAQEAVRAMLENYAFVRMIDTSLGLFVLEIPETQVGVDSSTSCYELMCQQLSFTLGTLGPFWMRRVLTNTSQQEKARDDFKRIGTQIQRGVQEEANDDFKMTSKMTCTQLQRGCFEKPFIFHSEEDLFFDNGDFMVGENQMVVRKEQTEEFEFDLRAVCDHVIWIESHADHVGHCTIYGTFKHAPRIWLINDEYRDDERKCMDFNKKALTFAFHLSDPNQDITAIERLRTRLANNGIDVRDSRMVKGTAVAEGSFKEWYFTSPVTYALDHFITTNCHVFGGKLSQSFLNVLATLQDEDLQVRALLEFQPLSLPGKDSIDIAGQLVDLFRLFLDDYSTILCGLNRVEAYGMQDLVYKLVVTPSRFLIDRPQPAPSNRVFRRYGSKNFLYVYFRDENYERLELYDTNIRNRLRDLIFHGIRIGSDHFQFLGCSLSQVRNASCIFTLLEPQKLREWVGELENIQSPSKYFKRLSQAFSSTTDTDEIDLDALNHPAEDIKVSQDKNSKIFTDGCGEISISRARGIAEHLELKYVPSAFQVRVGGAKGVLVVSSNTRDVQLRQSMVKFKSTHHMLEVVSCAVISQAYLTRQSILILNELGVPDSVFMSMQDEYLENLASTIASDALGFKELCTHLPGDQQWWLRVDQSQELQQSEMKQLDVFHRRIVNSIYKYKLLNTALRARIPITQGRALMGVADFTGTLKYGEVFVQFTERDEDGTDHRGVVRRLEEIDVVVHRSPCHHPGDIRVLKCRSKNVERLEHLKDVIVFPTSGPRPHPDECTGGDLDGDMYTVIWDERLIPPRSKIVEPMKFDVGSTSSTVPLRNDMATLVEFYLNALENDILGKASLAHLALSDASSEGCFDPNALKLAKLCAAEVDFCKNIDNIKILKELTPKKYPDFMETRRESTYQSQKVLGKMYRRCLAVQESVVSCGTGKDAIFKSILNQDYLVQGYETYRDVAQFMYEQYKCAIQALLRMSGAESEAELATGMLLEPESLYRADYFRFGTQCQDAYYRMKKNFFTEFERVYTESTRCQVAAAWYEVAYTDKDTQTQQLGFPWVVAKYLVANKISSRASRPKANVCHVIQDVVERTIAPLSLSIKFEVEKRREGLLQDVYERLVEVCSLQSAFSPHLGNQVTFTLFGSSALLTFEPQSDLDIMVHLAESNETSDVQQLSVIKRIVESEWEGTSVDLKADVRVPILCFAKDQWSIEMCVAWNGPRKTQMFRAYIEKYPFFWPCVYFLLEWGKKAGIVRRRCGGGFNLFSPIGFWWLFLRFCLEKQFVHWISMDEVRFTPTRSILDVEEEYEFWTKFGASIEEPVHVQTARVMLLFLKYYGDTSTKNDAYGFEDQFDPSNNTNLNEQHISIFREKCYGAFHQLVRFGGDVLSLLRHQRDQSSRITLSRAFSNRVEASPLFYARKIVRTAEASSNVSMTKATLCLLRHPNALRPDLYVADITGDSNQVYHLEQTIQSIEQQVGAPKAKCVSDTFHHAGCSLLLFEGASTQCEKIGFTPYHGERQREHDMKLHQAHLICFVASDEWIQHATSLFCSRFLRQMARLSSFERLNSDISHAKAIVRFGHHYLIHVPPSLYEESITDATIDKIEQEFERGRNARELYESVLVARSKEKEASNEHDKDEGAGEGRGPSLHKRPYLSNTLKRAKEPSDSRGIAHSFTTMIDPKFIPSVNHFVRSMNVMEQIKESSESYQVSIFYDNIEFNVRLTNDLQFRRVTTRPLRWFSTTLKTRQEITDDEKSWDGIPDVRYYVSTSEDVAPEHPLHKLLCAACSVAECGRGVLEFIPANTSSTQKGVRVSKELIAQGIGWDEVSNARHIYSTSYQPIDSTLTLRILQVRQFEVAYEHGFHSSDHKTEVEIVMPSLTSAAKCDLGFAKRFLRAGINFITYLREKEYAMEGEEDDTS